MASSAVFTSSLKYSPGGGGTLTQSFPIAFTYTAVSAGKFDVDVNSITAVEIPFGGVEDVLGLIIRNNTDVDVTVSINESAKPYNLAPGGMLMHWAPKASAASKLSGVTFTPTGTGPTTAGSFDYIVLGS